MLKLGSLFDGAAGFPLAAVMCGIEPVWASEIEPFPIAVTHRRFPNMKHLGDVSKVNGAEIAHPEETLEPLGNNIYFDPKHRIVPEEIVRVFTVEITQIGATEHTEEYLKSIGQAIADEFAAKAYPFNIDNVRCIRAQQFITKCHEEEV